MPIVLAGLFLVVLALGAVMRRFRNWRADRTFQRSIQVYDESRRARIRRGEDPRSIPTAEDNLVSLGYGPLVSRIKRVPWVDPPPPASRAAPPPALPRPPTLDAPPATPDPPSPVSDAAAAAVLPRLPLPNVAAATLDPLPPASFDAPPAVLPRPPTPDVVSAAPDPLPPSTAPIAESRASGPLRSGTASAIHRPRRPTMRPEKPQQPRRVLFACRSMTRPDDVYTIEVTAETVSCNCHGSGTAWCSHIEATMVAGERAMVPDEDRAAADAASALFTGHLIAPPGWHASWRQRLAWRGLGTGRKATPSVVGLSGRPVVCFTGATATPRSVLLKQAREAGWEAIDRPHSRMTVLVATDPNGISIKLIQARKWGTPILSLEEWMVLLATDEVPSNYD